MTTNEEIEADGNRAARLYGLTPRQFAALEALAARTRLMVYVGNPGPHGGLGLTGTWCGLPHVIAEPIGDGRWVQTRILRAAHSPEPERYNSDDVPVGRGPYRSVSASTPAGLAARGARTYPTALAALRAALKAKGIDASSRDRVPA